MSGFYLSCGLSPVNLLFLFVALCGCRSQDWRAQGTADAHDLFQAVLTRTVAACFQATKPHFTDAATMGTLFLKMQS